MRARAATIGDLEAVFDDLSERMADDYASSGLGTEATKDALMMDLKEGRAHALLDDTKPVAIITWHESDGGVQTLFAGQETFFTASRLRFCKRHIRRIQVLEGNRPLYHQSWLGRSEITRWFLVLGFIEKEKAAGLRLFELPPAQEPIGRP